MPQTADQLQAQRTQRLVRFDLRQNNAAFGEAAVVFSRWESARHGQQPALLRYLIAGRSVHSVHQANVNDDLSYATVSAYLVTERAPETEVSSLTSTSKQHGVTT